MLVDTHCHLTYPELRPQIDAVLRRAADAGVTRAITIATSIEDARQAAELCRGYPTVFMAAGIHPHEAARCTTDDLKQLEQLHRGNPAGKIPQCGSASGAIDRDAGASGAGPVAVGETGLDFHYDFAPRDRQEEVFRFQLELAVEVGRPVVIHARKSEQRVCDVLADYPALGGRVVFHCFSADAATARRLLDMGFFMSFTGVATFKNAYDVQEAARAAPLDRIMVETDAPYLSPEPVRKVRPCEPGFVAHTARFIAGLRGMAFEDLAAQTTRNAEKFFGLPPVQP